MTSAVYAPLPVVYEVQSAELLRLESDFWHQRDVHHQHGADDGGGRGVWEEVEIGTMAEKHQFAQWSAILGAQRGIEIVLGVFSYRERVATSK